MLFLDIWGSSSLGYCNVLFLVYCFLNRWRMGGCAHVVRGLGETGDGQDGLVSSGLAAPRCSFYILVGCQCIKS